MKLERWQFAITSLVLAVLACQALGGRTQPSGAPEPEVPAPSSPGGGTSQETDFPMPSDAENVIEAQGTLNFQTGLSLEELAAFYRDSFTAAGYVERELLTVIEADVISLVFDGHASGQAIVVQGVDLGSNRNINIRFEDA